MRGAGNRIGPKRKLVQWLCSLLVLAIPFIRVRGESLLRLDAPTRTLLFFGGHIRIEEFYLFLIVVLILVFAFLFVTMLFGRVWCGWLCPQTTLCDIADWLGSRLDAAGTPRLLAAVLRHIIFLLFAGVVAANLVWYFIPPFDFFRRLWSGEIGAVAGISLVATASLVYLDLAFVRRTFCKTVCPYGRVQLMTMDAGTLTLGMDPKLKESCLRCAACVRACPMEIDIRNGLQIECINCGRCVDACRDVMERTGGKGLIRYSFGEAGNREARKVTARIVVIAGLLVALVAVLVTGLLTRKEATVEVQRAANAEVRRLPDGSLVNFFTVYVENRSASAGTFDLEVTPVPGYRVELVGPVREIRIAANGNEKVNIALKVRPAPAEKRDFELRLMKEKKSVATARLPLLVQ